MSFIAQDDEGLAARLANALRKPALGLKRAVEFAAFIPGVLMLAVAAPLVLVAEILGWLRSGAWPAWSFGDVLDQARIGTPQVSWAGLQSIFDLVMGLPGSVGLFTTGLAMVVAVKLSRDSESEAKPAAAEARP
jgi:hypothetical protein